MDIWLLTHAMVIGLAEGVAEFLPLSSTGHLFLIERLSDLLTPDRQKMFMVSVQIGATFAVVYAYRKRVSRALLDVLRLKAAGFYFIQDIVIATISNMLDSVLVALAMILIGVMLLWKERRLYQFNINANDQLNLAEALPIGLISCSLVAPIISRLSATVIGGYFIGISRAALDDFSFFWGFPALSGTGISTLYHHNNTLILTDWCALIFGGITSFISAFYLIRLFGCCISRYGFCVISYYRIFFGIIIVLTEFLGLMHI